MPTSSTALPHEPTHRAASPGPATHRAAGPGPATDRTATSRAASRRVAPTVLLTMIGVLAALTVPSTAFAAPTTRSPGPAIEGFSPYQGQATCSPVARPGTLAFRGLVMTTYPGTGDSGIARACSAGGTSEHKEGRAWDWRVNTANPTQVAQVDDLLAWLTAPDEFGNQAAMARRLGVMYVIWNSRVWKSYQASRGWQPYVGANAHTDHVHVSFSWAGAYGATSYWSGRVAPVMQAPVPPPVPTAPVPTAPVPTAPAPTGAVAPAPVDRATSVARRRHAVAALHGPWRRH